MEELVQNLLTLGTGLGAVLLIIIIAVLAILMPVFVFATERHTNSLVLELRQLNAKIDSFIKDQRRTADPISAGRPDFMHL